MMRPIRMAGKNSKNGEEGVESVLIIGGVLGVTAEIGGIQIIEVL